MTAAVLELTDDAAADAPDSSRAHRSEQRALTRTIGQRLRTARELCNMLQQTAAERLGYSNSSKLNKIEQASDTNSVPNWVILRAAMLYEVSTDYLFGLTADWEFCPRLEKERIVSPWLAAIWEEHRQRDMLVLGKLHDQLERLAATVDEMVVAAEESEEALRRFREIYPGFDELRASRVVASVARNANAARRAKGVLRRFHLECENIVQRGAQGAAG